MSQVRLNKNGYPIKECNQCHRDININSFPNRSKICNICIDNNIVKVWEVNTGDYNDVWNKMVVKGNAIQVEKYVKSHFSSTKGLEGMDNDSIGYCRRYKNGDLKIYVEALEIESFDQLDRGYINVDLTEDSD